MKIRCSWCGTDIGEKECSGPENDLISHGICERCFTEAMAELEGRGSDREKKLVCCA